MLDISEHWEKKLAAISCYRSQFVEGRSAESPTFLDRLRDQAVDLGLSDRREIRRTLRQPRADRTGDDAGDHYNLFDELGGVFLSFTQNKIMHQKTEKNS